MDSSVGYTDLRNRFRVLHPVSYQNFFLSVLDFCEDLRLTKQSEDHDHKSYL